MEAQLKSELGEELYHACAVGSLNEIRTYLSRRQTTEPSYKSVLSATMQAATLHDQADIVSYCLERGATVTDSIMSTVVSNSSINTHKLLVESKAVAIDRYVPWFGTVLAVAATDGAYDWTKFCLQHGADATKDRVDEYKTVLAAAAEAGHAEIVKLLLQHGAELQGSGAIVLAAEAGKKDMVEMLLELGEDVNEIGVEHPTDERETEEMGSALHKAVQGGYCDVVELLLERGADIDLPDVQGRTPLALAKECRRQEMVELLKSHGAK